MNTNTNISTHIYSGETICIPLFLSHKTKPHRAAFFVFEKVLVDRLVNAKRMPAY